MTSNLEVFLRSQLVNELCVLYIDFALKLLNYTLILAQNLLLNQRKTNKKYEKILGGFSQVSNY